MLDRTDRNRFAEHSRRLAAAVIADRYIPAVDRQVAATDNYPPDEIKVVPTELLINSAEVALPDEAAIGAYAAAIMVRNPAIECANDHAALVKAFIADNPVIQTGKEAQQAATWIESTRKTLAAMEDERKPKTVALNAALGSINGAYRPVREMLESMLGVLRKRWNKWEADERAERERVANAARIAAEEAARRAQELIDQANDAVACAEVGECADVGTAIIDAKDAMREANVLDRAASRADKAKNVRVASTLGGRALASRRWRVIVIDDPCAAIKAVGMTEGIQTAICAAVLAYEETARELPPGVHEDWTRSI